MSYRESRPTIPCAIALVLMSCIVSSAAHAVAYCALRDPVATIYSLFPEADNYRSVVGTVGRDVRETMRADIPFDLHFNELGRHTLYIAQRGTEPLGLVHARSEQGDWGIDEFVWSISPSLRILAVKVQRTRDFTLRQEGIGDALQPLIGLDIDGLLALHATGDLDGIAATLARSAIKTLFVTKHVWREEIREIAAHAVAQRADILAQTIVRVQELYDDNVTTTLRSIDMEVSPVFDRPAIVGYKLMNHLDKPVGLAVLTPLDIHGPKPVWWVADLNGEIQYVGDVDGLNLEFSSALGYAPVHPRDCSSAVDLAALEIATLARGTH